MPIYVDTLPQNIEPSTAVSIYDVLRALPDKIDYDLNVWVAGKLARYGWTSETIIFLVEMVGDPPSEVMQYFSSLMKPLGLAATASSAWRNEQWQALRLYNGGRLIVDRSTMSYTELPMPVAQAPRLTVEEVVAKLPPTVPWQFPIWLTGGLVKNGWSANDADVMVDSKVDRAVYLELRQFFTKLFGWKTDVGSIFMPEREPIYLYKIYDGGKLCL